MYHDPKVSYRRDLVDGFPAQQSVPACFEACAKYIPMNSDLEDVTQASGPASSTTRAQVEQDAAAEDAQEMTKWLSIVEDQLDDVSELTSLPSLQGPRDIDPPALLDRGRGRGFAAACPRPWRTEVYVHRCRARAQGLLERMESQAGRVVATELSTILGEGGCQRLDEVGRERLQILARS